MEEQLFLSGLSVEKLSEIIREIVRDELKKVQAPVWNTMEDDHYLSRKEVSQTLKISLVTLTNWINRGKIKAYKIGGRVLFRNNDVQESVTQMTPLKYKR